MRELVGDLKVVQQEKRLRTTGLEDFEVTDADAASAFHKLADKLSKTPDNIPAYFWKRAAAPLFHIICLLFNLSLVQGIIPSQWKTAIIVPVYKKGSHDNSGNYRPISLTCVLSCVFEYIWADKMLEHLYSHNLLSENQFGFLPQHSACSQLLCV